MGSDVMPLFNATQTPVDLVCVTYEGDARLMVLQMLSVDRLLDHANISRYLVVLNGADNNALADYFQAHAFPRLSTALRGKVEFMEGKSILGGASAGWRDQQAIKLLIAEHLDNDFYLLLDAKNHFTRPTQVAEFFAGRAPKTWLKPMPDDWVQYMRHSLRQFRALTEDNIKVMPPTVTPYVMIRAEAIAAVQRIEADKEKSFTEAFADMGDKATEFFLYYAHFISGRGAFPYVDAAPLGTTLYTVYPKDPAVVHRLIGDAAAGSLAVFGLHRKRLPQLTQEQRSDIAALWRKHLLMAWEDAEWFMTFQDSLT